MSLAVSTSSLGHTGRPPETTCEADSNDFSDFEDNEDDFSDDDEVLRELSGVEAEASKPGQIRERVEELVQTEAEYIRDLEVLLHVINETTTSSDLGESASLTLRPLLGNIMQVMDTAKKFLSEMEFVLRHTDEDMQVGKVFLKFADDLCEAYKVYCSNYNVEVIPLLKKYESDDKAQAILKTVAEELRQHKAHLFDVNSVLIKPVQRVLKYPLYLAELLRGTPDHYRDLKDLQAAHSRINDAAREINEYTRAIDLVHKYRTDNDHSIQGKMRRVNFHSIVKKSNRMSTYVSQKLGITNQTTSSKFVAEEARFRSIQKGAEALVDHVTELVEGVRARHTSELLISEAMEDIFPWAQAVVRVKAATLEACNRLLQQFDHEVEERVLAPARAIVTLCEAPDRLIAKTQDKLLDYEAAQARFQSTKDLAKSSALEEEVAEARETYEALNNHLLSELPVLNDHAIVVLEYATRSLVAARLYFQGHLARLYLQLTTVTGLSFVASEEIRDRARRQVEMLRDMLPPEHQKKQSLKESKTNKLINTSTKVAAALLSSRGSVDVLPKSLQRPVDAFKHGEYLKNLKSLSRSHSRRSAPPSTTPIATSTENGVVPKDHRRRSAPADYMKRLPSLSRARSKSISKLTQKYKKEVLRKYPPESVYEVTEEHTGGGENELALHAGEIVAVIKKKDPMGGDERWVVDNGDKVGLVRASYLQPSKHEGEVDDEFADEELSPSPRHHRRLSSSVKNIPDSPKTSRSPSWTRRLSQRHSNPQKTTFTSYVSDSAGGRRLSCPTNSTAEAEGRYPHYDRPEGIYDIAEGAVYQEVDEVFNDKTEARIYDKPDARIYDMPDANTYGNIASGEAARQVHETENSYCTPNQEESQMYYVLYSFAGEDSTQLSVKEGQRVRVLDHTPAWWYVSDAAGNCGYVPASYLQTCTTGVSTYL